MFNTLSSEHLEEIARRKLAVLRDRALTEDFVFLEYDETLLPQWLVERLGTSPDCRRLNVALETLIELPLARWRMERGSDISIVRLEPKEKEVRVIVEERPSAEGDVQQLLFQRVAELFAQEQERERRRQTARVVLGGVR